MNMTLLSRFRMGSGPLRASSFVLAMFCAGFLALASCGGGGGGSGGGTPNPGGGGGGGGGGQCPDPEPDGRCPDLPKASDFEADPEYFGASGGRENWALDATGVAAAYARIAQQRGVAPDVLAPGEGVAIAIIDSGVDTGHPEFAGASLVESLLGGEGDAPGPGVTSPDSHGTQVASVILAQRGRGGGNLGLVDRGGMAVDTGNHNFHGIAWEASLRVFSVPVSGSSTHLGDRIYAPVSLEQHVRFEKVNDSRLRTVLQTNPDIVSISIGNEGHADLYDEAEVRPALQGEITARAQGGSRATDKTLIVLAAGNENGAPCVFDSLSLTAASCVNQHIQATSPALDAALQAFFPELREHVVTVVSTDIGGNIAVTSNRCGIAAKWCIAAPGQRVLTAWFSPETSQRAYQITSGTSFAAPHVAGGLALLLQLFSDQMTHEEILQRLYDTANKIGTYAPDSVATGEDCPTHLNTDGDSACELSSTYGQGLMDLDNATRSQPPVTIALGDTLDDRRVPAASSGFQGGAAFGNALATGLRGHRIAVFDRLDAPFQVDLDRFAPPAAMPSIGPRLARFLEPDTEFHEAGGSVRAAIRLGASGGIVDMPFASTRLRFGINHPGWEGTDSAWATGHASLVPLADGGASLTLGDSALQFSTFLTSSKFADAGQIPKTAGAMLSWKPADGPLDFRVAALREFGNSLGLEASGAFGEFASNLAFAGVGLRAEAAGWEWSAAAEFGRSTPKVSPGSVREVSGLSSSAFAVSGERSFQGGGRLNLSAALPLRVERGRLRLRVASGRDKQRNVQYESVSTSLVPSGRQVDLGVNWRQPLGVEGGELRLGAVLSLEPGHEAGRSPELALMVGYRLSF